MKNAIFNVFFPANYTPGSTSNVLNISYTLEYSTPGELHMLWQEARQVWSEFIVEVDANNFIMVNETPYSIEAMELN